MLEYKVVWIVSLQKFQLRNLGVYLNLGLSVVKVVLMLCRVFNLVMLSVSQKLYCKDEAQCVNDLFLFSLA